MIFVYKIILLNGGLTWILLASLTTGQESRLYVTGLLLFIAHLINFIDGSDQGTVLGQSLVFIAHIIAVFVFCRNLYFTRTKKRGIRISGDDT